MPDLIEYLRTKATEAERSLRLRYAARSQAVPAEIETEMARLATHDTADALLARYEYAKRVLRDADAPTTAKAADTAAIMDMLVQRVPVVVTLSSGRQVGITSKSLAWMRQVADLWAARVALEAARSAVEAQGRLSDLPTLRQATRASQALLERIVALAVDPRANPQGAGDPPPWISEITAEDIEAIQAALLVVGEGRLAALPDPEPAAGDDGAAKQDPVKQSFGSFLARVARQRGVSTDAVLGEDFARLVAELRATADQPSAGEADLFG
jgi:hypothetical protein